MPTDRAVDLHLEASDQILVRLVSRDRSEAAFRALYRRHTPRLVRVAARMLSVSESEDAIQEAWLRATGKFDSFEWQSTLSTWLTAIVMNVCREMLARQGRWIFVELDEEVPSPGGINDRVDVERAIALLPPACRAVFILHDVEGFTHQEIANQLGCSAGTSKTQVFRARRAIRERLGAAYRQETSHGT